MALTKVKNVIDITADTMADLLSMEHKTGSVQPLGYHERGDGGGGVFYWDDSESQTEHNGGTIIAGDAVLGTWDTAGQEAWFTAPSAGVGCWVREYSGALDVKWFGAKGDGVSDDTHALFTTLEYSSGNKIDGGGRVYRIVEPIDCSSEDIVVENMTIDASDVPDQVTGTGRDFIISFTGTKGTSSVLSSNAIKGDSILTMADTSKLSEDSYAWLSSDAIFESGQSVVLGQVVKVKSIDSSTQVTLYTDVLYDYTTTDTATLAPLNTKKNITFKDVKFIGANAYYQSMLNFDTCEDVVVDGCYFEYCDYVACRISRTINFKADKCTVRYARSVGNSYGFAIVNGSYYTSISNSYGEDLRHFVTVGDNDGVNLFVNVSGNHVSACQDAGIDSHAACDFMTIDGNTIEGASIDSGQLDGIIFQGLNCILSNNIVVGARRYSLFFQCLPDIGTGSCVITGNSVRNSGGSGGTEASISVTTESGGADIDGVTISGNVLSSVSEYGIHVYGVSGNIKNVSIIGNTSVSTTIRGVLVRANSGYTIEGLTISSNTFKGSGGEGIYLLGATTQNILNSTITGNVLDGFLFGVRLVFTDGVVESGNNIMNYSDPYEVATTALNVYLDSKKYPTINVTNSTFALEEHNDYLICNRAGTITLTFRNASQYPSKEITIKNVQAQTVVSASSNIVPITSTTEGTAILPATAGSWCTLRSDGTNWVVVASGG